MTKRPEEASRAAAAPCPYVLIACLAGRLFQGQILAASARAGMSCINRLVARAMTQLP